MDPRDIREFASRRWDLVDAAKSRVLDERFVREGKQMGLRVLAELRGRVRSAAAQNALADSRADDLDAHRLWVEKLAKIRDGLARR